MKIAGCLCGYGLVKIEKGLSPLKVMKYWVHCLGCGWDGSPGNHPEDAVFNWNVEHLSTSTVELAESE